MTRNYHSEWLRLRKLIKENCERIKHAEDVMDLVMKEPSSLDREGRIAWAMNQITIARQSLLHFGLNIPLDKLS
jgi:hypothetical protein